MFVTGCCGSMPWIAAVASSLIDVGGTTVRATSVKYRQSLSWRYS